jgi:transposase-like protein
VRTSPFPTTIARTPKRQLANHFTLSRESRDLDLESIERRSDDQVFDDFMARRYAATGGRPDCPHCKGQDVDKVKSREMLNCRECRRQFSPRKGTTYYKSKLSIYKLDKAAASFALKTEGLCASELAHDIFVEPKTAFRLLQKFRNGFLREMSLETFVVDVRNKIQQPMRNGMQFDGDEIGGFIRPKNVKKTENDHRKVPYRSNEKEIGIVLIEPGGRVRVAVKKHEADAVDLIRRSAKRHTIVYCDLASHWKPLRVKFELRQVNHSREYATPWSNTNRAESFNALTQNLEGCYHHISGIHLLSYLSEGAWRRENNRVSDGVKYNKFLALMLRPIPASPKFNRNVKREMKIDGRKDEYFALREVAAAAARALAFVP